MDRRSAGQKGARANRGGTTAECEQPDIIAGCCGGGSNFGGHGHFYLSAYDDQQAGHLRPAHIPALAAS